MPVLSNTLRRARTSGDNPATADRAGGWDFPWRSRTNSSIRVNSDRALALTTVYRCVTLIAATCGGLPLHVYEKDAQGQPHIIETPDTSYLWLNPNDEMTPQTLWETAYGQETLGDAFLFVDKEAGAPNPDSLWYIEPERVRVGRLRNAVNGIPARTKIYEVDGELPMIDYRAGGEIVHIPNWGRSPLRGINPISVAAEAIGLSISAEEYAARFFDQDSTPRGLLTTDANLNDQQADTLAARWEKKSAGLRNAHRTAVLGSGAKFQAISVNPSDAQLLEERKFQVNEIARLFGVPPHMVGDVERSTSWGSGIEEQTLGFLQFTLQPHIRRFEQAINTALLMRELTGRYVKFDLDGLLRGTTLRRYQAYAIGYGRFLTTNDIRRDEDLPPIEGGDELVSLPGVLPLSQTGGLPGQNDGNPNNNGSQDNAN